MEKWTGEHGDRGRIVFHSEGGGATKRAPIKGNVKERYTICRHWVVPLHFSLLDIEIWDNFNIYCFLFMVTEVKMELMRII